jgi:hypothetical protein
MLLAVALVAVHHSYFNTVAHENFLNRFKLFAREHFSLIVVLVLVIVIDIINVVIIGKTALG